MPPEGDIARVASRVSRLSHRIARHIPAAPVRLAPDGPLVSFSFDDVPRCAGTFGARMLEEFGARGTFYIAGGLVGTRMRYWPLADANTIAALHEAGHEIGSHTYSHAFIPHLRGAAIAAEARRNDAYLRAIVPGLRIESFAYPYGYSTLAAKRVLKTFYRSGRSILPGLNLGRADRLLLRANPLIEGGNDAASIARLMDDALARGGWLIFYGHDVAARPSPYGCTPGLLGAALRAASERGIACVTVAEGLRRATAAASRDLEGASRRCAPRHTLEMVL